MQRTTLRLTWLVCAGFLLASPGCGSKTETTGSASATDTTGDDPSDTSTAGPTTDDPTGEPTTGQPTTGEPTTGQPTTGQPTTGDPSTGEPSTFLVEPDMMTSNQCDPMEQNCPDGQKCTAVSPSEGEPWGINVCVDVNGSGQVGDPCDIEGGKYTGVDNCDVGFICLLTDDDGFGGTCTEFCDSNMECPQSGNDCEVYNDGSLPICLGTCDPLLQDCPEGQGCYRGGGGTTFVCFKVTGESAHADECGYINQCLAGFNCSSPDAVDGCPGGVNGCCSSFCDLSDPDPDAVCVGDEQCISFFEGQPPPQYEDVGVCLIPAP